MESTLSYPRSVGIGGGDAVGAAQERNARQQNASRTMMMVSVILAFLRVSSRNAITPFDTASTPVIAVHPDENTLSSSHRLTMAVAAGMAGSAVTGCGCPPIAPRATRPPQSPAAACP